ncbi:MAG: amidohydrolase family protein [Chromatiales bacterium]|jgi:predicted TIM-barrel fold metal-dependent hydrolase|nr:amidohydrolase family protein [Chromatiales bacterium]
MRPIEFVDAHHHFWDPTQNYHPWLCDEPPIPFRYGDYGPLRRPYMPPDYFADATPHRVLKTVYVEAEWDPTDPLGELEWVHGVYEQFGYPNAVVAQGWLDTAGFAELARQMAAFSLVRSVRHKPASARSAGEARRGAPGSMDDPVWRDGYAALAAHDLRFDLQTPWWHLDAAIALATDMPTVPLIVNHAGLPSDRSKEGLQGWYEAMGRMSEISNVVVKISGLGVPGEPWTVPSNRWIVREIIAMFGVERCMFATNFPVDGLCASYRTIVEGFAEIVSDLDVDDQQALFVSNALRTYAIDG